MYNQQLKQNLNRLDSVLKQYFENVNIIAPRDDKNYTFKINVSSPKSNPGNKVELVMEMTANSINNMSNNLSWSYRIDPRDEDSDVIVRNSSVNFIYQDVSDIILNERFSKDYVEECKIELINEDNEVEDSNDVEVTSDREWEFNVGDEVMVRNQNYEGAEGTIKEQIVFKHGEFENNTYMVEVNGETKRFFEYDVFKK